MIKQYIVSEFLACFHIYIYDNIISFIRKSAFISTYFPDFKETYLLVVDIDIVLWFLKILSMEFRGSYFQFPAANKIEVSVCQKGDLLLPNINKQ